jgi:adenine-specific DNA-methyltransferase
MDEVFGRENFVAVIPFTKTRAVFEARTLRSICDYLLWYAKHKPSVKYHPLYTAKDWREELDVYSYLLLPDGEIARAGKDANSVAQIISKGAVLFMSDNLIRTPNPEFSVKVNGRCFIGRWRTNAEGMKRLALAERLFAAGNQLRYIYRFDDFRVKAMENIWLDTIGEPEKLFVVQTNTKVVERCILMTTDPGDLVFDPTCGSGTTAYCAEKWGRRWITCDTSRVALAIARQRLMTAKFDYYELADPERGPAGGFIYETVPHITLESIAKNTEIDEIAAKYQPEIDQALANLNEALGKDWKEWEVPREIPNPVWSEEAKQAYWRLLKLKDSLQPEDRQEAERLLKVIYQQTGHRWTLKEIPEPVPPEDWSDEAKEALRRFWELKRKKRREIDESIQRHAPQEILYDRPKVRKEVVRVSGPFTVEAIPVPVVEDPTQVTIPPFETQEASSRISDRGGDYLTDMLNLLRQQGGVIFPGGRRLLLENLRPCANLGFLHAEGETKQNGKSLRVAISFGPPYGPVTAYQVQEAVATARMNAYDLLLFAGFGFDPEAQSLIQRVPVPNLQVHFVNIAPDVLVGDLLKTTRASQIFTAFGQPDVKVEAQKDGTYLVRLLGVDIYDPITGEVHSESGDRVAAWFLDTDYDGKTFHICQAFFPGDPDAWEKLQRALKATIPEEAFEKMRGTVSFPFKPGEHKRIAVKVIDFRGNEVMRVIPLEGWRYR